MALLGAALRDPIVSRKAKSLVAAVIFMAGHSDAMLCSK
jgi:hypothetical protein